MCIRKKKVAPMEHMYHVYSYIAKLLENLAELHCSKWMYTSKKVPPPFLKNHAADVSTKLQLEV